MWYNALLWNSTVTYHPDDSSPDLQPLVSVRLCSSQVLLLLPAWKRVSVQRNEEAVVFAPYSCSTPPPASSLMAQQHELLLLCYFCDLDSFCWAQQKESGTFLYFHHNHEEMGRNEAGQKVEAVGLLDWHPSNGVGAAAGSWWTKERKRNILLVFYWLYFISSDVESFTTKHLIGVKLHDRQREEPL